MERIILYWEIQMCFMVMLHTKGYKYYNPQTRQTHVSMDASFWENQSYFSISHLQRKKEREEDNF